MNKMVAKFTNSEGSRLTVFAKNGKRGVNCGASLKIAGEAAATGCRSTVATEAEGAETFSTLKAAAIANGWSLTVKKDRSSFTDNPAGKSEDCGTCS